MIGFESLVRGLASRRGVWLVSAAAIALTTTISSAHAETLGGALAKAYFYNPDINQQRAAVRVADENMPKASAGFLPTVNAEGDVGLSNQQESQPGAPNLNISDVPRGYGITASETLWNGNRTINSVRQAESGVLGAREQLRNTEQNVLLAAVTFYMDVMRDTAILGLDRNNVEVLQEQLRQTQDRFNVGEVTRTDVAQAEASLAGARATALTAETNLQVSIANYRRTIGEEPKSLSPVAPIVKPIPKTLPAAIAVSQVEFPAITAMLHGVDAAQLQVKINEGQLYPTVGVTASVNKRFDVASLPAGSQVLTSEVVAQVTVPIYEGGAIYAATRQAKEQLSQQELQTDLERENVRSAVVAAWGANQNSLGILRAAQAQVEAAEVALAGVREEAKVGQRTTLDVLNQQQTLLNARVQLVIAEHDQVVNSYNLLSSVGRLSIRTLGLAIAEYDPRVHFDQVKNKWIGLRTPDGR
ncbi:MAG: TolC family outer membrane protein [Hyphomicrobiales bacterium]|nr:TolC family outer membrane protein [Hyphomicrobiales bacterium]